MADSDVPEAIQASDEIAALVSPTVSDYWRTLHGYTPEAMAAAALANGGGGGGGGIELLGPYSVDASTPNYVNPADNGIPTLAIPANTMVLQLALFPTDDYIGSQAGADVQIYVSLLTAANASGPLLGAYQPNSVNNARQGMHIVDAGVLGGSVEALAVEFQAVPAITLVDAHIYASLVATSYASGGSFDLYALTASLA